MTTRWTARLGMVLALLGLAVMTAVSPAAAGGLQLNLALPAGVTYGQSFSATLTVENADGSTATGFTGTVLLSANPAVTNLPSSYTFTAADAGVHAFTGLVATQAGTESITASLPGAQIAYGNFSSTAGLRLNGAANQSGTALRLVTTGQASPTFQDGSAFSTTPVDPSRAFQNDFQFTISAVPGLPPADGFVFMLQNDPRGVTALGPDGGGLGYGPTWFSPAPALAPITPSAGLEFDIYNNGECGVSGAALSHVGLVVNGMQEDLTGTPCAVSTPFSLLPSTTTPVTGHAWIDYDGAGQLTLYLAQGPSPAKPSAPLMTAAVDLSKIGSSAYAGFSAATGLYAANFDINSWQFQNASVTTTATTDVAAATLTVTADNQTRVVGAANPPLTYTITGFVNGDTSSVVSGSPDVSTTATSASPVGTYPITITQGSLAAANYQFQFVDGTLTVTYGVCPLFDQTQPHQSGSVIPVKLALCDAGGASVSSASVTVTAVDVDGSTSLLQTAGNANPDDRFRFDGGRYVLNLQTTGLTAGTHTLDFTVSTDPNTTYSVTFVVR